ncbi:hypothetical protein RN001_011458 [Aquatica leii]|uniref:Tf2-1-like SH3-like domain-containing protein n=1 Tax=Aquatica leii TaxID=1421715 RepID=A0AAN7P496_9COLE|nr:hypothetical protein RN001_011458 [Aquatica leii]
MAEQVAMSQQQLEQLLRSISVNPNPTAVTASVGSDNRLELYDFLEEPRSREVHVDSFETTLRSDEGIQLTEAEQTALVGVLNENQDVFIESGEATPYAEHEISRSRETNELRQDESKRCSDLRHREVAPYEPGDKVLVEVHALSDAAKGYTSKFAPRRDGPYLIETQCSPTTYKIASVSNPNEIIGSYHVSALRPFVEDDNNDEVFAPIRPIKRRGRPKISQEVVIKQPDAQPVTAALEVVTTVKSLSNGRPVRRRQPKQPCVGECCRTSTTHPTSFDSSSTTN